MATESRRIDPYVICAESRTSAILLRLKSATEKNAGCEVGRRSLDGVKNRRFTSKGGRIVTSAAGMEAPALQALEVLRPVLCTVVDGEDHDAGFFDGIYGDKGRIRNYE